MELVVVATCAHLAKAWGGTAAHIHGFSRVHLRPTLIDWDSPEARLKSMGLELVALAQDLADERPDLVLVLGDREDALLAATAAVYSWVPVAHIFGGDLGHATVDDSVRHAVSKLAHLHFAASEWSRDVLVRLGEAPERIHVCGNPALDRIRLLAGLERRAPAGGLRHRARDGRSSWSASTPSAPAPRRPRRSWA
jgi:GDP/UDP-N,N'-diacetylbacillosamine 2-epimerase (hydrolysing)